MKTGNKKGNAALNVTFVSCPQKKSPHFSLGAEESAAVTQTYCAHRWF